MNDFENFPPGPPPRVVQLRLPLARPWLSWVLLGLIILIFLGQLAGRHLLGFDLLLVLGAKVNEYILAGEWWRLLTPVLLHVNLMHLAFNAYALYVLGPAIEAWYGAPRFAAIYLVAALAGNVFSFVFTPSPSAGASTALFGLIAAELVFFFRNRDKFGDLGQRRLTNIVGIIIINFALGLSGRGIDNFGHLGGLLGGAALSWLMCPRYEIELDGPAGLPRVVDRNSLQQAWPGVALVTLLILGAAVIKVAGGR